MLSEYCYPVLNSIFDTSSNPMDPVKCSGYGSDGGSGFKNFQLHRLYTTFSDVVKGRASLRQ